MLLTTAQVAEKLAVSRSTVLRMVDDGKLKPALKGDGPRGPMWFNDDELPKQS